MLAFVLETRYLLRGRKDPHETPVIFAKRRVFRVFLDSQYLADAFVIHALKKHYFLCSCCIRSQERWGLVFSEGNERLPLIEREIKDPLSLQVC